MNDELQLIIDSQQDQWLKIKRQLEAVTAERDAALEREQALAAHVDRLNEHARLCADELAALIDKHNVQSDSDGSWLYDHQTPFELMQVVLSTPTPEDV